MKRTILVATLAIGIATAGSSAVIAETTVPGHSSDGPRASQIDADNNGIPDAGVYVTGEYTALYAYDGTNSYYWDLGDGRVQGTVDSVDELDEATLTTCDYVVGYRGDFGNDPSLDQGWVRNNIKCSGYDDNGTYDSLIVSDQDPRYTGNPDWSIWGTWEYHTDTYSGSGNLVRPQGHVGG